MRVFSILLGSVIALSGCSDADEQHPISLKPGTFYLELFDENGVKIFEREGEAIGLGSYGQIIFQDPTFMSNEDDDSTSTFAYLLLSAENEKVWDEEEHWSFDTESRADLFQKYYTWIQDWGYESVGGEIEILESTDTAMKGRFSITMKVKQEATGELWQQNEAWGEHILVKGIFNSKGW